MKRLIYEMIIMIEWLDGVIPGWKSLFDALLIDRQKITPIQMKGLIEVLHALDFSIQKFAKCISDFLGTGVSFCIGINRNIKHIYRFKVVKAVALMKQEDNGCVS